MGEFRVTINPKNKPATPEVNWQQARVLEMQAEYAAAFDTQAGTYEEMRAAYREERKMWNSGGPEMAETIDFEIPFGEDKVPARLLRPVKAEKLPVIFFMHGGGFVSFELYLIFLRFPLMPFFVQTLIFSLLICTNLYWHTIKFMLY